MTQKRVSKILTGKQNSDLIDNVSNVANVASVESVASVTFTR